MNKTATIKQLDKKTDNTTALESSKGQPEVFLSSNKTKVGCPLLHLRYQKARHELLASGMTSEDLEELEYLLKGVIQCVINQQLNL